MAIGSSLLLVLANPFVGEFEKKAITEVPHPSTFWGRYVDDARVVIRKEHEDELCQHINQQHNGIKFTIEEEVEENSLP